MSFQLETLNRGTVDTFGYSFMDVGMIRLGDDLPPIHTEEYFRYSVDALIDAKPALDEPLRQKIAHHVAYVGKELAELPDATDEDVAYVEFGKRMGRQINRSDHFSPTTYAENPFVFRDGRFVMGSMYEVAAEEFAAFSLYVLHGGFLGWNNLRMVPNGTPVAVNRLRQAYPVT